MIETREMKIEDFLAMMAVNTEIYPQFQQLSPADQRYLAEVNIIAGDARSFYENGQLVGVGGIRYKGLGEGWMLTNTGSERALSLLKQTRRSFINIRDENNLWRVFASARISENFLEHLGFEKKGDVLIWTRTN